MSIYYRPVASTRAQWLLHMRCVGSDVPPSRHAITHAQTGMHMKSAQLREQAVP